MLTQVHTEETSQQPSHGKLYNTYITTYMSVVSIALVSVIMCVRSAVQGLLHC